MKLGIIGKPQSGKTTVFNAASGQQETVGDFSQAAHRAVIKVPDSRVEKLAEIVSPKKITFAEIDFLDAPGFSGKGKEASELEVNPELKQMDALILVGDCFSDSAAPDKDIQDVLDEMVLADQLIIESNVEKRERKIKLTADKTGQRELELLKQCGKALDEGRLIIDLDFTEEEHKSLRGYTFLTQKPLLVVLNIKEEDLKKTDKWNTQFRKFIKPNKREVAPVCGKIEMELVGLRAEEKLMFMQDLGIATPAMEQVISKAYNLLGLISFLTAGEPEVRAWTIKKGWGAQKAAGVIHSDIERGFIRAEVVRYDDYVALQTSAAIKAAGRMRLEGKEYVIQDGDVILFRFNV